MAATINVSVDDTLKNDAAALFADFGLTLEEAVRIFLQRSVQMQGIPFPMRKLSDMEIADAEIQHYKATGKGLVSFKDLRTTFEALDCRDR